MPINMKALQSIRNNNPSFTDTGDLLKSSKLTDEDAEKIAEALKKNTHLEILHLQGNKIGPRGIAKLTESLEKNVVLKTLGLGGNPVGEEGAKILSKFLKENHFLTTLGLGSAKITETGCKELIEAAVLNPSIQKINLKDNLGYNKAFGPSEIIAERLATLSALRTKIESEKVTLLKTKDEISELEEQREDLTNRIKQLENELNALCPTIYDGIDKGSSTCVKKFLKEGNEVATEEYTGNNENYKGFNPLRYAVVKGNPRVFEVLWRSEIGKDERKEFISKLLVLAVKSNRYAKKKNSHQQLIDKLIELGFDLNAKDDDETTTLEEIAKKNDNKALADYLAKQNSWYSRFKRQLPQKDTIYSALTYLGGVITPLIAPIIRQRLLGLPGAHAFELTVDRHPFYEDTQPSSFNETIMAAPVARKLVSLGKNDELIRDSERFLKGQTGLISKSSETEMVVYSPQKYKMPFLCDGAEWTVTPDPITGELIFQSHFTYQNNEIASATFYGQPSPCLSADGKQSNVLKATGVLVGRELGPFREAEICSVLPPTLPTITRDGMMQGARMGFMRGMGNLIGGKNSWKSTGLFYSSYYLWQIHETLQAKPEQNSFDTLWEAGVNTLGLAGTEIVLSQTSRGLQLAGNYLQRMHQSGCQFAGKVAHKAAGVVSYSVYAYEAAKAWHVSPTPWRTAGQLIVRVTSSISSGYVAQRATEKMGTVMGHTFSFFRTSKKILSPSKVAAVAAVAPLNHTKGCR